MLKVSVKNEGAEKELLLEVEGRLAGPWVGELERCWDVQQKGTPSNNTVLRLSNVTFIDEAGKDLLSKIFHAGAKLEGSGCMVRAIIARITGSSAQPSGCGGKT